MISLPLAFLIVVVGFGGYIYIILTMSGIRIKLRQNPDNEELAEKYKLWKARFYGLFIIICILGFLGKYLERNGL